MLRRDQLCPGSDVCPYVRMEDPHAGYGAPRCTECPVTLLDEALNSLMGQWIASAIDLEFALQAGVTVSLKEIGYPEFLLLRLLAQERNRYHEEVMNQARHGR